MITINFWAVLVAAIVSMVLGMLWFSPTVFGKIWAKEAGKDIEEMTGGSPGSYLAAFVGAIVVAYILAVFEGYASVVTTTEGLTVAFYAWLGFVVATSLTQIIWEGRSKKLYAINNGYQLISLLVMGVILAVWR